MQCASSRGRVEHHAKPGGPATDHDQIALGLLREPARQVVARGLTRHGCPGL
jgi:hypothetical protein